MPYEDWWWDVVKATTWKEEGGQLVEYEQIFDDEDHHEKRTGATFSTSEYKLQGGRPVKKTRPSTETESRDVDPKTVTENTPFARLGSDASDNLDRKESPAEKKRRERDETAAENREYVSERGYDKIKKPANKKKEGWWDRVKQKNLIPGGGRKINENVPLVGGKRVPTMNLDDIDQATDRPGTKASRAIDRTKEAGHKKLQDRHSKKREKRRKEKFQEHLKTPEGKAQLAAEKERRKKIRAEKKDLNASREEQIASGSWEKPAPEPEAIPNPNEILMGDVMNQLNSITSKLLESGSPNTSQGLSAVIPQIEDVEGLKTNLEQVISTGSELDLDANTMGRFQDWLTMLRNQS